MKTCTKCKEEKSLDDFYNCKSRRDGKYPSCKVCVNAQVKKHSSIPSVAERRREYDARAYKKNREAVIARSSVRRIKFPEEAKAGSANHKARKLGSHLAITGDDVKNLFDSHGWCCYYCDVQSTDPSVMTLDHVVPFARGGQNTIQNCVPACAACNLSKKDQTEREFNNA